MNELRIEFETKREAILATIACARQRIRIAKNDKNKFTGHTMADILERDIMCHQDAIIRLTIRLERLRFKYDMI